MSLSAREQQALDGIENRLADSDPKLARQLASMRRLVVGLHRPAARARPRRRGAVCR